jgi:UDP-N-acetylmuramoyl-tripeptide--D-alanyl-D-alanine ligase
MDAYNANVTSMLAALESFNDMEAAHKTVILGDMRELGSISAKEHQRVVDYLHTKLPEWQIFLVGEEFGKAVLSSGMLHFSDSMTCKKHLERVDLQNQFILVKGSRGIVFEKLIDAL